MKPVSPVIPGKNYPEVNVAERQEEYKTLPGIYLEDGNILLSRWEFTEEEMKQVIENKYIYLYLYTFGRAVSPVLLSTKLDNLEYAKDVFTKRFKFIVSLMVGFAKVILPEGEVYDDKFLNDAAKNFILEIVEIKTNERNTSESKKEENQSPT